MRILLHESARVNTSREVKRGVIWLGIMVEVIAVLAALVVLALATSNLVAWMTVRAQREEVYRLRQENRLWRQREVRLNARRHEALVELVGAGGIPGVSLAHAIASNPEKSTDPDNLSESPPCPSTLRSSPGVRASKSDE